MNSRQRVLASINHKQPDRVPIDVAFAPELENKLLEDKGMNKQQFLDWCGQDMVLVKPIFKEPASEIFYADPTVEVTEEGYLLDIFRVPFKLVESIETNPLPPGDGALLGTAMYYPSPDMLLHYDVFHSVVWGTRDALRFGLVVALFSALFGILFGAVSGYIGGIFNDITMRFTDAFLAFPIIAGVWLIQQLVFSFERTGSYLVAWYPNIDAVVAPLTARQRFITAIGLNPVLIAFILFSWMAYARLINAGFLRLKTSDYIMAARTIGASHLRVIPRHLLPNAITPIVVLLARDIGAFVVLRAAFSFIGMGGSILTGLPEWDRILLLGRTWVIGVGGDLLLYWWLYLPVTLTLVLFGTSWNMLGDRLNVLLNPREEN